MTARAFCVACALIVLPLAPVAIATIGMVRQHPIPLDGSPRAVLAVRFGAGEWVASASPEARRRFRNVPVGSPISYRLDDGTIRTGRVENVPASRSTVVRRVTLAILTLVFTIAGLALGLAGQNRAASSAGAFLSGAGATLGFGFLEPNLVLVGPAAWRDAIIIAYAIVPSALWCRYLLLLAAELPVPLPLRRADRLVIACVSAVAIVRAVLLAFSQAGPLFDPMPFAPAVLWLLESGMLQIVPYLATATLAIVLIVRQRAAGARTEMRQRARIVGTGFAIGLGVPLTGLAVQFATLLLTGRLAIPRQAMAVLLLPLLLVPVTLTYALLARRVERIGVLVRRAVVFAVATRTLTAVAAASLLALGVLFYRHRHESIAAFLSARALVLGVLALAVAGAFSMRRVLERVFFRDREHSRRILGELTVAARDAGDAETLASILVNGVDEALHVEAAALFVRDRQSGMFVDAQHLLAPLDPSSCIVLGDLQHASSEVERQWIGQRQFRIVVPVKAADGSVLALLALGEKMSGLPFDGEDHLLLEGVAASAALALDNLRLRGTTVGRVASAVPDVASLCPVCDRLFDPLECARCLHDDAPLVAADVPLVLDRTFRLEQRIGSGAAGVVYRARDLALGRNVAIKTLPRLSADAALRFEHEARAVAALAHPNIATIHAAETWHGRPMLVFEYLDEGTLADRIRRGPVAPAEVLRIGHAVADALVHAHAAGVLHRDIKPSNIGFMRDGTPKLLDFGLAQHGGLKHALAGTAPYLSPESITGAPAMPQDDLWSLAVTLYEACTGRNPFAAANPVLSMNRVLAGEVPDPPGVPPALAAFLQRALHRDPALRPRTAAEFRALLRPATPAAVV